MVDKVSVDFSFKWDNHIWQTAADASTCQLLVESRAVEDREVFYDILDFGNQTRKEIAFEGADWWTMLLKVKNPFVFMERYEDAQDPSKKDLLIYNIESGKLCKELRQFQYLDVTGSQLLGHDPGDRTTTKTFDLEELQPFGQQKEGKIVSPVYYAPHTDAFKTVYDYLELSETGLGCEYLEYHNYIIISYYERLGTKFDRKLLVIREESEIYAELLDEGMDGFASGAFFIMNDLLVFIKNRNEINGIKL